MPTFIGGSVANRTTGGGGGGFGPTQSLLIEFGNGTYLANVSSHVPLNFGNSWSASIWAKTPITGLGSETLMQIGDGSGGSNTENRMDFVVVDTGDVSTSFFAMVLIDNTPAVMKTYRWTNAIADSTWQNWVVTWDGTLLLLYYNGSAVSPTTLTLDNPGTMSDSARDVAIGVDVEDLSSRAFNGNIGHVAIWNSVLTGAESAEIFSGKFSLDLTANSGAYVSSANLKHYWRPFFANAAFSDDAGTTDLVDSTATVANMVTDAP